MRKHIFICSHLLAISLMMIPFAHTHARAGNEDALKDVSTVKVITMISSEKPKKVLGQLDSLIPLHDQLRAQGVKLELVVVFIGPSVRFVMAEPDEETLFEHDFYLRKIENTLKQLAKLKSVMEVCTFSTNVFKLDHNKLIKPLKPVGNGYISMVGYQAKGYESLPLF